MNVERVKKKKKQTRAGDKIGGRSANREHCPAQEIL